MPGIHKRFAEEEEMKAERKVINDILWAYANRLDELNTSIRMYDILLKDLENPLKATIYDKEPSSGGIGSTTETAVILRERYNKSIEECTRAKEECLKDFERYISPLKYHCKQILRAKYIEGKNIRKIALDLCYSEQHTKLLLSQAQDILYEQNIKDKTF